jgi:hypothetical protein
MPSTFHTNNISKRLYARAITFYLWKTLSFRDFISFKRAWKIDIYPSEESVNEKFFDGNKDKGIGGVTGMNTIKLYLYDKDDLNNTLYPYFRPNMIVISHELCHAILIHKGMKERTNLRNDDWSGNKRGKILNFSTAEVHDRHIENKFFKMPFNFWDWVKFKNYKMNCTVLDIRDIVKST